MGEKNIYKYLSSFFWNLSTEYGSRIKLLKVWRNFTIFIYMIALVFHKISEKLSRNNFLLKFRLKIWIEFGTKHNKFHVKQMSIHLGQKSISFTHKRTFLSILAVTNKKFIENLVERIWGSNLSQKTIHIMTNVS